MYDMETICANCGKTYWEHYGLDCPSGGKFKPKGVDLGGRMRADYLLVSVFFFGSLVLPMHAITSGHSLAATLEVLGGLACAILGGQTLYEIIERRK